MLKVYFSDRYVPELPPGHRFPIAKYQLVREQLLYEGTLQEDELEEAKPVSEAAILRVHDPSYWQAMQQLTLGPRQVRRMGFPQSKKLVDRSRRSVQGTLSAARHALQHGLGINLAGGTHHAFASHGEGFCLLNDLVITARQLLHEKQVRRILVVDLDVHQGNGSASLLADEEKVFTFSMHGKDNYPLRKERSDLDLALPSGTGDEAYLSHLREVLPQLINQHQPDLILYQSGVDVLESDALGKLSLSRYGCKTRDRIVFEHCAQHQIPVAVCMGGGYSRRLRDTVEAHANTFRVAKEVLGG
jgi:acetoin utilization deacetylase AcuC-like enzyme